MKKQDICRGFRLAAEMKGDWRKLDAWLEINRLNQRSSAAWVRGNNSGNGATLNRCNEISDKAWEKAKALAKAEGWRLEAPGLNWCVMGKNGQEIRG